MGEVITWRGLGDDDESSVSSIAPEQWSFSESLLSELYIIVYSGGIAFGYNSIPLKEVLEVAKAYKEDVDSGTFQLRLYLVPIPAVTDASTATTRSSGTAYWQFGSKGKLLKTAGEILINLDISRVLSSEEGNSLSTPRSYVAPMDQMHADPVDPSRDPLDPVEPLGAIVVVAREEDGGIVVNDDEDDLNSAASLTEMARNKSNFHHADHADATEGIGDIDDIVSLGAEIRVDEEDSLISQEELGDGMGGELGMDGGEVGEGIGEVDPDYRSPADEMISLLGLGGSAPGSGPGSGGSAGFGGLGGLGSSGQLVQSRSKSASGLSPIREGTPKRVKSVQVSRRTSMDLNSDGDGLMGINEDVEVDDQSEDEEYEVDSNADFNFTVDDDHSSIDWAAKFNVPNNKLADKYSPNLPKYEVYIEDLYTSMKPANILLDFMKVRATRAVNAGPTMDGRKTARALTAETAEFHKVLRRMRSQSRSRMISPASGTGGFDSGPGSALGTGLGTGGFSPWSSRSGVFSRSGTSRAGSSGAFYDSFADGSSSSGFGPFGPFDSISSATSSRGTVLAQSSISSAEPEPEHIPDPIPIPVPVAAPKVIKVRRKRVRVSRPRTSRNIAEAFWIPQ